MSAIRGDLTHLQLFVIVNHLFNKIKSMLVHCFIKIHCHDQTGI